MGLPQLWGGLPGGADGTPQVGHGGPQQGPGGFRAAAPMPLPLEGEPQSGERALTEPWGQRHRAAAPKAMGTRWADVPMG